MFHYGCTTQSMFALLCCSPLRGVVYCCLMLSSAVFGNLLLACLAELLVRFGVPRMPFVLGTGLQPEAVKKSKHVPLLLILLLLWVYSSNSSVRPSQKRTGLGRSRKMYRSKRELETTESDAALG